MDNIKKAYEIAIKYDESYDCCVEYKDHYMFCWTSPNEEIGPHPVVVDKNTLELFSIFEEDELINYDDNVLNAYKIENDTITPCQIDID